MTLEQRLLAAHRRLWIGGVARALLLTTLVVLAVVTMMVGLDLAIGLPRGARLLASPVLLVIALAVLVAALRRPVAAARQPRPIEQTALWVEAQATELRYALVTAVDEHVAHRDRVLALASRAPVEELVRGALRRGLLRPTLSTVVLVGALLLAPRAAIGRLVAPAVGDEVARAALVEARTDPLAQIVVRITPPSYLGGATIVRENPSVLTALPGSRVEIEGAGAGVDATLGTGTLGVEESNDRWRVPLLMPSAPGSLQLRGGARSRLLVLDPLTDSVPEVRLELPARDSVLRVASGRLRLEATLRDDHGLSDGAFEYIVSAGAGETFTFKSARIGAVRFPLGATRGRLRAILELDSLKLGPGDLIHIRAVAQDRNSVGGPGRGASETRSLRLARADEYDSVSVDPLPPSDPEKNALSQRMLLVLTEALVQRAPRLTTDSVQRAARRIAVDQSRLRKRVGELVFERLGEDNAGEHSHFAGDGHEHGPEGPLNPAQLLAAAERATGGDAGKVMDVDGDETPVVAINRPLLEAYNHMWQASSALETGRPAAAIPWMRRAIEALQRARAAERIYLRGRPPRVVIDLNKVRLAGKELGAPSARQARKALEGGRALRLARFDAVLAQIALDPGAAADSLLVIRLALPASEGSAIRALDSAAEAVRRGGEVTEALALARRALAGPPITSQGLSTWSGR